MTTWRDVKLEAQVLDTQFICIGVTDKQGNFLGHINLSMSSPTVAGEQTGNAYYVDARDSEEV